MGERRVHNHGPEDGPGLACRESLIGDCIRAEIARLTRELEAARELIREMTGAEHVFADPRARYIEVQIDRETWEAARAFAPPPE